MGEPATNRAKMPRQRSGKGGEIEPELEFTPVQARMLCKKIAGVRVYEGAVVIDPRIRQGVSHEHGNSSGSADLNCFQGAGFALMTVGG